MMKKCKHTLLSNIVFIVAFVVAILGYFGDAFILFIIAVLLRR